jgi:hypothetical protein
VNPWAPEENFGRKTLRGLSSALVGQLLKGPDYGFKQLRAQPSQLQSGIQAPSSSRKAVQYQRLKIRNDGVACSSHASGTTLNLTVPQRRQSIIGC